ncbi:putative defensin-like protein [Cardamine amara subsp. amara]|uniref:Defensin-like protein n=1 Tax=Cardamine amara subsp. amara TaxID=228776 RepID=A0ABD1AWF6_CARAN
MVSSKNQYVSLLIIVCLLVNSVQSTRIMDDPSQDCEFKGPCQTKRDCFKSCGGTPPYNNALCVPYGNARICCCIPM